MIEKILLLSQKDGIWRGGSQVLGKFFKERMLFRLQAVWTFDGENKAPELGLEVNCALFQNRSCVMMMMMMIPALCRILSLETVFCVKR